MCVSNASDVTTSSIEAPSGTWSHGDNADGMMRKAKLQVDVRRSEAFFEKIRKGNVEGTEDAN